jgi:hypothetical protein
MEFERNTFGMLVIKVQCFLDSRSRLGKFGIRYGSVGTSKPI